MPTKTTKPRTPNLDTLLARWQVKLGLADWQIEAEYAKADQRDMAGKYGSVHVEVPTKRAWITVLHPAASEYGHIEATIVHELIHIHLFPLTGKYESDSLEQMLEEQAVHAITRALVGNEYEDAE